MTTIDSSLLSNIVWNWNNHNRFKINFPSHCLAQWSAMQTYFFFYRISPKFWLSNSIGNIICQLTWIFSWHGTMEIATIDHGRGQFHWPWPWSIKLTAVVPNEINHDHGKWNWPRSWPMNLTSELNWPRLWPIKLTTAVVNILGNVRCKLNWPRPWSIN